MSGNYKRKANDQRIIDLNMVGLSLSHIAAEQEVHHTTITHRLKVLGIPPADTRRSFMGDIFVSLSPAQQDWLIAQLGPGRPVKEFVRSLIIKEYVGRSAAVTFSTP